MTQVTQIVVSENSDGLFVAKVGYTESVSTGEECETIPEAIKSAVNNHTDNDALYIQLGWEVGE